jgi:hypothetical protein
MGVEMTQTLYAYMNKRKEKKRETFIFEHIRKQTLRNGGHLF